MKYIRIKDGKILELARFHERTTPIMKEMGYITLIDRLEMRDYEIRVKDITKQADTIEELCDEFVIIGYDKESDVVCFRETETWFERISDHLAQKHKIRYEVYGAIWTDKGLIYVAKMNDKGEFIL